MTDQGGAEIARVWVVALEQHAGAGEDGGQRRKESFPSDDNRAHLRYCMQHKKTAETYGADDKQDLLIPL